jgi:hypothetical protein
MRRFSIITLVLAYLAPAAAPTLSIAASAAVPPPHAQTASLQRPLPAIRRLPPISESQPATFSIQEITAFDSKPVFDEALDDSLDAILDPPAAAAPGKPRVGGWIEVGYGAGWNIQ